MKMVEGLVSPMVVGLSRTPKSRGPFLGTPKNPKNTPPPKNPKNRVFGKKGGGPKMVIFGVRGAVFLPKCGNSPSEIVGGFGLFSEYTKGGFGTPKNPLF